MSIFKHLLRISFALEVGYRDKVTWTPHSGTLKNRHGNTPQHNEREATQTPEAESGSSPSLRVQPVEYRAMLPNGRRPGM